MNAGALPALRVGLLGCGVVGSEVARLLEERADELAARAGSRLELSGIAVRTRERQRQGIVDQGLLTTDAASVVAGSDLVVELIGGLEPARELILAAFAQGASVVTANKTLLAADGATLAAAADKAGRGLHYEAAVAGAIPILRPLRESLAGDHVVRVTGIVNGTTNFILDKMTRDHVDLPSALSQAQALGFAETDPTDDIEGNDAAAKAAILASLAFHTRVHVDDVHREGIDTITAADIDAATSLRCVVKLLAICARHDTVDGPAFSARVHPAMIPAEHPLASVHEAYNAVFVETEAAGRLMFYGQGAGGIPTASAVLGDLVAAARDHVEGGRGVGAPPLRVGVILPMGQVPTRYFIALAVADRPGVLAAVADEFARHGVSIQTVRQDKRGNDAQLVVVTHEAAEAALAATVSGLRQVAAVQDVMSVIRVEADGV